MNYQYLKFNSSNKFIVHPINYVAVTEFKILREKMNLAIVT